ncbi:MAG: hypothetical protein J6W52_09840 [Bacteroidaceae bacterium]|nr:hypothetical protein [Bacteroidaceae bacterium]
MKQKIHYINRCWRAALLLLIFNAPCSMFNELHAQAEQDALFIFRNDGLFNAFFFSDIDRFAYSKIDTLGVEHNDYVTQEIHAMDSVFRIPLTAIDSISFVTPENKLRDDVFHINPKMFDYAYNVQDGSWVDDDGKVHYEIAFRLRWDTPKELVIPMEDDQAVIFDGSNEYFPEGFAGMVTMRSLEMERFYWYLIEPVADPSRFYDVLVVKGSSAGTEEGNQVRRKSPDADWSYESAKPIEFPALSLSASLLSGQHKLTDDPNAPIQFTVDGSVDLSAQLTSKVDLRCFLYINALCNQTRYYQIAKFDNDLDMGLSVTGALTAHADIPFTFAKDIVKNGLKLAVKEGGKKLSGKIGGFMVDFSFGLFVEGQATVSGGFTWSNKHKLNTILQFDKKVLSKDWESFYHWTLNNLRDTTSWNYSGGKFGLSTGIYGQAEAKLNLLGVKAECALRADAGLKSEFDVPVFTEDQFKSLIETPSLYTSLNHDNNITITTPGTISFSATFGKWIWTPKVSFSLVEPMSCGIVPNIFGLTYKKDTKEPYRFTFESPVTRKLLLPDDCGFAVFNEKDSLVDDWWWEIPYWDDKVFKKYSHVFETLDPLPDKATFYTVRPQIEYLRHPILVDRVAQVTVAKANIEISKRKLNINEKPGYEELTFIPNMKNVEIKSDSEWLTFFRVDHEGTLTLYWNALPEGEQYRVGNVYVTGMDKDSVVLVRDTIVVEQMESGFIPIRPGMEFLGTWEYGKEGSSYYVAYRFGSDGSYYNIWDTNSEVYTETGTFSIISYDTYSEGDYTTIVKIFIKYKTSTAPDVEKTKEMTVKIRRDNGKLQSGANLYKRKE